MSKKPNIRVPIVLPLDSLIFILQGHEVYMNYALPDISLTLQISFEDAAPPSYSVDIQTIKEILHSLSLYPGNENLIKILNKQLIKEPTKE